MKVTIDHHQTIWKSYKVFQDLDFSTTEDIKRFEIFRENSEFIISHNRKKKITYVCAHNNKSHYSSAEYIALLTTKVKSSSDAKMKVSKFKTSDSPVSIDWRNYGYVTRVKDQQNFGTSWAFSVVGAIESANIMMGYPFHEFSEQQLIDCVTKNSGCKSGSTETAMDYTLECGLMKEEKYPYVGEQSECRYTKKKTCLLKSYKHLEAKEEALQQCVGNNGPVSVCIDAYNKGFAFYSSGVYYDPEYKPQSPNQSVLCVGYGKVDTSEYWILKNSWGEKWGNKGYIYTARNKGNFLGIADFSLYPVL